MRLYIIVVLAVFTLVQPLAMAQQAGENINVLPVVFPQDDPDWQLKGDGYLQRQVEPSIAASTRNPDHLVAFFNDYRAVDIADDVGLGEAETMIVLVNTARKIMMAASWLPLPELHLPPTAAAEAWVGMSRSYDGGLTWSGAFLPGGPFDASPASLAAPVYGLQAATDPVVAPGPCGKFYVVFMAFNRGDESKLVVARYQDLNNNEGGDSIVYQGMTVVESGNNATNGYFLDKPDIEVDIFRGSGGDRCADSVYVSYSTFNGLDKDGKFQSKVSFARSFDGGLTFDTQKLNPPYNQNQGSALAVDPTDGTIYMIWRHFWAPDAILMVKSADSGKKWSKPVVLTEGPLMAAFDQPTISTTVAPVKDTLDVNPGFPETAFRSNGFPTAAVTDQGVVFAAWQERVNINPSSTSFGRPDPAGSPRIVVVRSTDGGQNWTDIDGAPDDRRAVDLADRDTGDAPTPGFGTLHQERSSGPQVMPKLSFGGGRLMLAYYESRGRIANYGSGTPDEWIEPDADTSVYTDFISGYDRVLDLRAALLDPTTGDLLNEGSTTQVSRYPIRAGADLSDGEDFTDVAAVNSPCFPDSGLAPPGEDPYPPCIRQVNRVNAPQSAAGTSPFIGDYIDLAPMVQFIFDGDAWRWATALGDVPTQSFQAIFADNRHLIPPPGENEWTGYPFYNAPFEDPPNNPAGCVNPGSRNTDVLTSKVSAELVLSAPTTYKQLEFQRGFPISIKNQTGETQTYFVEIIAGAEAASFGRTDPLVDSGTVAIFPYSGTALMVYVDTDAVPPVKVQVTETGACGDDCASGTITLNLDPDNPPVAALDGFEDAQYPDITNPFVINPFVINGAETPFVINPFVINPFVINEGVDNPFVINPFVINPFVINPFVINPFVINPAPEDYLEGYIESVVDTTWTVTAGDSNTASSYLPLINIDNAQAYLDAGYVFQLIAYKGSLYGGLDLDGCSSANVAQPQILANVTQDPNDSVYNPFVINPFVINPFVINPFVINPFVINSTFTMAPSDDFEPDDTTKAPPASNEVKITLRAFKTTQPSQKEGGTTEPPPAIIYDPTVDPPSLVVVPLPCDPDNPVNCDVASNAPDLIALGVDNGLITADAGGTVAGFPDGGWTLVNQGTGDATAENGILRHGLYICDPAFVASYDDPVDGRVEPLQITDPRCSELTEFFTEDPINSLAAEATTGFGTVDLSIPADVAPGEYSLVLYVDDTLEISEKNEVNNWIAVPLTIVNPPPTADDLFFDVEEDSVLTGVLVAHDTPGEVLTYSISTGPSHGTLSLDVPATGEFTYTPTADYYGPDSFTYLANDGTFDSNTATVTITVIPVNDAPTASDATFDTDQNTPLSGVLPASDIDDADVLDFTITDAPTSGTAVVDNSATGTFTYVPNAGFAGVDEFTFQVADLELATATGVITINVIDTTPDWLFIGFANPWRPNYKVNAGSAIPLKWYYTDPNTGDLVDSSTLPDPEPQLEIRITGYEDCDFNGIPIEVVEDPGSSDLRYVDGSWQFNWDTSGLPEGCYELGVYHPVTNQFDRHSENGDELNIKLK